MKTQNLHSCFSDCFPFLKNKLLTPVARAKIFFTLDDLATLCVFPGEKKALYHLSCHLITVSLWDANSTLMFSFVRVSWQSPQRWSNYRQLFFFLIIFLTLGWDWLIHQHTVAQWWVECQQSFSMDGTSCPLWKNRIETKEFFWQISYLLV